MLNFTVGSVSKLIATFSKVRVSETISYSLDLASCPVLVSKADMLPVHNE